MNSWIFVVFGLAHLLALAGIIVCYCRRMQLPVREWPLYLFLFTWASMVLTGYLLTPFDAMNSLPGYIVMNILGLGIVLGTHSVLVRPARASPYAKIEYPEFAQISSPGMQSFLWHFFILTLVVAFAIHLTICLSFYPVNADSLNYRLARVFWYTSNGGLLHPFESIDKRLTFYPVNGLLLYVPLALYGVSGVFFSLPSLFSSVALGYVVYRFARELKADKLIATFATWLAMLTPSILIEASSTNDEILTAAPLLIGLYFLYRWLTSGIEHFFFLAVLGAGLSVGTKLHVFFLIPIAGLAAIWLFGHMLKYKKSWREYIPPIGWRIFIFSALAGLVTGPMFLVLNFISSGDFYFLRDTAEQVLNLGSSFQVAFQNFFIYVMSIVFAPIADLNIFESFRDREVTNRMLNGYFLPWMEPLVDTNPAFYHLKYKFMGVIIPTSVLLVEYGLWPGFAWLLWFFQGKGLLQKKFTLRPFFIVLAATPILWLVIWSCVTLYMEGVPTYFAFYLMCATPAMVFCLVRIQKPLLNKIRWGVIGFVMLTTVMIDGNVGINNTFRGLWHFAGGKPWPFDWLLFEQPIINEIQHAKRVQIPITHGKVYFFAFMHWNPTARYYTPYKAVVGDTGNVLHVLTMPSEYFYGYMPMKIPFKHTPGLTYLGHIRGVDREEVFAFGNDVSLRRPEDSNFISMHVTIFQAGTKYTVSVDEAVAGLNNPQDQLEFSLELNQKDGKTIYSTPWAPQPNLHKELSFDPGTGNYSITVNVRSAVDHASQMSGTYGLGGMGSWRISRNGETYTPDYDD